MNKYGQSAILASQLLEQEECSSPSQAWERATEIIFREGSTSSRKKACPRNAFLGLCEGGYIKTVKAGVYCRSTKNKKYATEAVKLVNEDPDLAYKKKLLWEKVAGTNVTHNNQMDVVIALFQGGLIQKFHNSGYRFSSIIPPEFDEKFEAWFLNNKHNPAVENEYNSFINGNLPISQRISKAFELLCVLIMDKYGLNYEVAPKINDKTPDFLVFCAQNKIIVEVYTTMEVHALIESEMSEIIHNYDVMIDECVVKDKPSDQNLESYIKSVFPRDEILGWLNRLGQSEEYYHGKFESDGLELSLIAFYREDRKSIISDFFSHAPRTSTIFHNIVNKINKYDEVIHKEPFVIVLCDGTDGSPLVLPDLFDAFFGPYMNGRKMDSTESVLHRDNADKISAVIYLTINKNDLNEKALVIHNPFAVVPISNDLFPKKWNQLFVFDKKENKIIMKLLNEDLLKDDSIFDGTFLYVNKRNYKQ
ncbi:MAG: hypothetical protein SVV67_05500 [Bacillota bacterium]|nr:hypothetical protein [Bacillota bacterium]